MRILETTTKRRASDDKVMLLGKVLNHEQAYSYTNENGKAAKMIPTMWIVLNIFNDEDEMKKSRRRYDK